MQCKAKANVDLCDAERLLTENVGPDPPRVTKLSNRLKGISIEAIEEANVVVAVGCALVRQAEHR